MFDDESDGIDGVVGNRKRLNLKIAYLERCSVVEQDADFPDSIGVFEVPGGSDVGIDGDGQFVGENPESLDVIAVFMTDEDATDPLGVESDVLEPLADFLPAESGIDKYPFAAVMKEGRISFASASEDGDSEAIHGF
jgi:hypothetical protein